VLVVTEGGLAGTRIGLTGAPVLIGRADDSTLVLTDDYASTRHARISQQDGVWFVEDLGSTNGTYLGQHKLGGPTPLEVGVPSASAVPSWSFGDPCSSVRGAVGPWPGAWQQRGLGVRGTSAAGYR